MGLKEEYNIELLNRGTESLLKGDYKSAAGDFGNVLRSEPNNIKARQMLEKIMQAGDMVSRIMAKEYLGYS